MNPLLRLGRLVSFLLLLALGAAVGPAHGQGAVGYGEWQVYLPNSNAVELADAGNRLYVAGADAFYYYDKELKTTTLLTRRDGLSDVGVRTVAYDSVSQQTVVAYRNGNLDILRPDGKISNVSDILRKAISGTKDINHIYFRGGLAYLSCSFGLLVLDMARLEVRATYSNIGPGGTTPGVYATTILRDSLYAATSIGLMRGRLTDNLLDYRRWQVDRPGSGGGYRSIVAHAGHVYAGVEFGNMQLFKGSTLGWQPLFGIYSNTYRRLRSTRSGILVTLDQQVGVFNANNTYTRLTNDLFTIPQDFQRDRAGVLYVADAQKGLLVSRDGGRTFESFVVNAPVTASTFSILADRRTNTVNVFHGGYADRYFQNDFRVALSEYKEGRWTYLEPRLAGPGSPLVKDLTRGVRTADGTLYVASYGNGLVEWKGPDAYRVFNPASNQPNPLRSAIPADPAYTRITDLTTDTEGNVWVVNRYPELGGLSGIHVFKPATNEWRTVRYQPGFENLDRLVLDDFNSIWASRSRLTGSIVAYDEATNVYRTFTQADGGLPASEVYAVVKDRKGAIWVGMNGTLNGSVAVYDNPSEAFLPGSTTGFRTPILARASALTSDVRFPTLRGEKILCIAVDGGNRKWFGTERGLWLFNENADEALLHFTTANSPLPSDIIQDVAVNDRTGEVFVATSGGLVSYQGGATITEGKPSCASVYPNPVRTNFNSEVSVSGLVNNAIVKITDVTGALVYQTRANGGTVTWNLADYNGRKVNSGVYLIMSSDADGNQGCLSKVAVVQQ